jgi:hypothetical protein
VVDLGEAIDGTRDHAQQGQVRREQDHGASVQASAA